MKADTTTTKNALSAIDSETEILDAVMSNAPLSIIENGELHKAF